MLVVARVRLRSLGEIYAGLFGFCLASWFQIRQGQAPARFWGQGLKYQPRLLEPLPTDLQRYQREPPGRDDWQTWAELYKKGEGDCEDLCIGLTACLWAQGERKARAIPKPVRPGLIHIVVRRADGSFVDPSKVLGMAPP